MKKIATKILKRITDLMDKYILLGFFIKGFCVLFGISIFGTIIMFTPLWVCYIIGFIFLSIVVGAMISQ